MTNPHTGDIHITNPHTGDTKMTNPHTGDMQITHPHTGEAKVAFTRATFCGQWRPQIKKKEVKYRAHTSMAPFTRATFLWKPQKKW